MQKTQKTIIGDWRLVEKTPWRNSPLVHLSFSWLPCWLLLPLTRLELRLERFLLKSAQQATLDSCQWWCSPELLRKKGDMVPQCISVPKGDPFQMVPISSYIENDHQTGRSSLVIPGSMPFVKKEAVGFCTHRAKSATAWLALVHLHFHHK
ncbi:unnamed protein product [Durusdinium trenchii]|uniref:Uncharacterized protein n=1 Tax=Durusdinium trenchii TaxID=1381693 RepID=A0ABP0S1E5_9DINO